MGQKRKKTIDKSKNLDEGQDKWDNLHSPDEGFRNLFEIFGKPLKVFQWVGKSNKNASNEINRGTALSKNKENDVKMIRKMISQRIFDKIKKEDTKIM